MKKLALIMTLFGVTLSLQAQELASGSLLQLSKASRVNVEIDFSEAMIDGLGAADFAAIRGDKWDLAQKELWEKFVNELNDAMYKRTHKICGHFDETVTLKFQVALIESKGDMEGVAYLLDASGNELAKIKDIEGEGGHVGSFYNLAGDGIREAGENLGKYLAKYLSKMR